MRAATTLPMWTPIAEVCWVLRLPILLRARGSSCATCIFQSRAWRTFSCTILEGACAIELENFSGIARSRRSRRSPQCRSVDPPNFLADHDVRVYLRARDGEQRLHAGGL